MDNPFNESDEGFFESGPLPTSPSAPSSHASSGLDPANHERDERSSVVAARGTAEGLVLRIDGRVASTDLHAAVREFLESRRSFLSGHDVAFEWVGRKPEDAVIQELTALVSSEFSISVRSSRLKTAVSKQSSATAPQASSANQPQPGLSIVGATPRASTTRLESPAVDKTMSLFDGMEGFDTRPSTGPSMLWDEPDSRIIYGTLRSGQKVETEHVILGTLRGIAHAGAYDESGGGRVIFSLNLQPTQLRIGLVISRGAGGERSESSPRNGGPEVARVESNMIVVEPYQSRTVWVRRRE
jgi:septum formation inhibitor MinC